MAQSGAYQMVHERDANKPPPPAHPTYVEEPRHGEEYPHYRGFIDQTAQSPSFKRLQELTGESGLDTEDEYAGGDDRVLTKIKNFEIYPFSIAFANLTTLPLVVDKMNSILICLHFRLLHSLLSTYVKPVQKLSQNSTLR